jgi:hypothetical protein
MATAADTSTGTGLHGAHDCEQVGGVCGGRLAGGEHHVVGGTLPLLHEFAPGHPDQWIPPEERYGRAGNQLRGQIAAPDVRQFVEHYHAAALLAPLTRVSR